MIIPTVPLSKIAKPISRPVDVLPGTSYRTIGVKWWGEGAYERETIDGSQTAAKTLSIVREGDLIINKIWVRHGSTAIAGKDVDGCAASGEFPTFALDLTEVLPRWLHWQTKTKEFWEKCDRLSQGTSGKNRIKPDLFLSIQIPLPPLEEQRRIVARVEELAGKIEEVRSLRQQALDETEALLGSELNALFNRAKSKQIEFRSIGSFTVYERYGPRFYNEAYSEYGVPIMRATDIDDRGRVNYDSMPKMLVSPEDREKLSLKSGDLVVVRSGSVGRATVFDRTDIDCIPSAYMIQFRFEESVVPHYVRYYFESPYVRDELKGRGTALKNINAQKIKSVKIPVPPLPEQRHVVTYLDNLQTKVDEMKRLREQAIKELDALLPSILDKAFKGEL